MKSRPVVALDAVATDVQTAYDYFEQRGTGGGDAFLNRYFSITDVIARNPETFSIKFDDDRRAFVSKSNLAVYYFIETDRAVIVAVIDARRNPRSVHRLVRRRR